MSLCRQLPQSAQAGLPGNQVTLCAVTLLTRSEDPLVVCERHVYSIDCDNDAYAYLHSTGTSERAP